MDDNAYNAESRYRFKLAGAINNAQRDFAVSIARQRITDETQLRQTIAWIRNRRRSCEQLEQLLKRWGMEMPYGIHGQKVRDNE